VGATLCFAERGPEGERGPRGPQGDPGGSALEAASNAEEALSLVDSMEGEITDIDDRLSDVEFEREPIARSASFEVDQLDRDLSDVCRILRTYCWSRRMRVYPS
jgi:hypothetical protein